MKRRKQTSAVGTANEVAASCLTETEEEGRLKEKKKLTQNFITQEKEFTENLLRG